MITTCAPSLRVPDERKIVILSDRGIGHRLDGHRDGVDRLDTFIGHGVLEGVLAVLVESRRVRQQDGGTRSQFLTSPTSPLSPWVNPNDCRPGRIVGQNIDRVKPTVLTDRQLVITDDDSGADRTSGGAEAHHADERHKQTERIHADLIGPLTPPFSDSALNPPIEAGDLHRQVLSLLTRTNEPKGSSPAPRRNALGPGNNHSSLMAAGNDVGCAASAPRLTASPRPTEPAATG